VTSIRVGIGGWTYEPWRGLFYPEGLRHGDELAYAAAHLTSIEINGTFYRTQTPKSFRTWSNSVPKDFVFTVKAHRAAAQRIDPDEARPAITRFLDSGLTELGEKLGPILWQLPNGRKFDPAVFARFLDLLPAAQDGIKLRHVVEAAHASFNSETCTALLRERGVARAILDKPGVEASHEVTADHVYLRLEKCVDEEPTGYAPSDLDAWADRLKTLAKPKGRSVFAYVISGAKHRAPAAAMGLIERLG
jgi:uncharacterized protein YecE (DUF72 family)